MANPQHAKIEGLETITRRLRELEKQSTRTRVLKSGTTKALRVISNGIKSEVPSRYRQAKREMGQRFERDKHDGTVTAKAGAGVGKATKRLLDSRSKRAAKRAAGGKRSGIGISVANLHWFILGTGQRRTKKSNQNRGTMPAVLEGVVKRGYAKASAEALRVFIQGVRTALDREFQRVKRK